MFAAEAANTLRNAPVYYRLGGGTWVRRGNRSG